MTVEAHGPHTWYLLRDTDGRRYCDLRVSTTASEYSLVIELAPSEVAEYVALGTVYLDYLAARVNHWPGEYGSRNADPETRSRITQAITTWQRDQSR